MDLVQEPVRRLGHMSTRICSTCRKYLHSQDYHPREWKKREKRTCTECRKKEQTIAAPTGIPSFSPEGQHGALSTHTPTPFDQHGAGGVSSKDAQCTFAGPLKRHCFCLGILENTDRNIRNIQRRCPGWRIHGSVEDTKLSTNKQHSLSHFHVATAEGTNPDYVSREAVAALHVHVKEHMSAQFGTTLDRLTKRRYTQAHNLACLIERARPSGAADLNVDFTNTAMSMCIIAVACAVQGVELMERASRCVSKPCTCSRFFA
jgi:hypothetical protein